MSASTAHARSQVVAIVDDDPAVRTSLLRLLKALGYTAKGYVSGEAFLAEAPDPALGCVVLDMLMPGLAGDRVLEHLRRQSSHAPVIIITGCDEPDMQTRLLAAGGRTCFTKPVDPRALIAEIAAALESSSPC